jgi:hypothetical protein
MANQSDVDRAAEDAGLPVKKTRDQLRTAVFHDQNRRPKSKVIKFFGQDIELRQGTLKQLFAEADKESKQAAIVEFLCTNSFVPGTDERLFEEGDADQFLTMPFGEDFVRVTEALQELTGVNFQQQSTS